MDTYSIYIKNMVCDRCIMVVQNELNKMNIAFTEIKLGEVKLKNVLVAEDKKRFQKAMVFLGFEVMGDRKSVIVEKIKNTIIKIIYDADKNIKSNLSQILNLELNLDYHYLSNVFSEETGMTIEKYFIAQKIEKTKELLLYDELTLSEIAFHLNYSSVAYLSNQFKKTTGMTPSKFKQMKNNLERKPLDKI
ncbi:MULTISPECIES: helix-turn-helix domain-containing protein [Chryseobacterium]|uniref:AraC family transcriptional regulator n=1 Tax=Chryseobacterium aquaticum subsp. greenlandense TaxID=345663 RepID=A0A117KBU8_9FLAO|nr:MULTISPECIES: AraC family transcriptional regulator [Chryseobacterium]KNB61175.1 AraC family transcriptional regulator [Chryseobacterium sp. Hurlbut01]KUJ56371.1 AraC family transcriptional regulator [Chryseobacterium aquaticum subsp. greenlandense]